MNTMCEHYIRQWGCRGRGRELKSKTEFNENHCLRTCVVLQGSGWLVASLHDNRHNVKKLDPIADGFHMSTGTALPPPPLTIFQLRYFPEPNQTCNYVKFINNVFFFKFLNKNKH